MTQNSEIDLSLELYKRHKNILLNDVPEQYKNSLSLGFILHNYNEFLKVVDSQKSLTDTFSICDHYYETDLLNSTLDDKLNKFYIDHHLHALACINTHLESIKESNHLINPFQCKELLRITISYYNNCSIDLKKVDAFMYYILKDLYILSPRSYIYINYLCRKYNIIKNGFREYTPGDCSTYLERRRFYFRSIKNLILLPIDYLIFLYQKY